MTNGENKSTAKQKLAKYEEILKEYTEKIGISSVALNTEVISLLSLNSSDMESMAAEDCGIGAYILSQYALYLQQEYNRNKVRRDWADKEINLLLANNYSNYGDQYTKWDAKKNMLIAADQHANALHQIIKHAETRISELQDTSSRISTMARYLESLQQTKRRFK